MSGSRFASESRFVEFWNGGVTRPLSLALLSDCEAAAFKALGRGASRVRMAPDVYASFELIAGGASSHICENCGYTGPHLLWRNIPIKRDKDVVGVIFADDDGDYAMIGDVR